ncbi:hypothetical protein C0J52_02171 [Blattella germanica]|nr:hypothetical protein C0J52_02171 [Blattella germanica]
MCGKVPHLMVGDVIYEQCRRKNLKVPIINEEASGSQSQVANHQAKKNVYKQRREEKSTNKGEYNPENINVPM